MTVKIILPALALLGVLAARPGTALAAGRVVHDRDEVLHQFFAGADRVETQTVTVTPELAARLKNRLGYVPAAASYTVWVGKKNGHEIGYAVVDDEKGMHEPITFAVLIGTDGSVARQEVLVYREPEGDGVTSHRFTSQFVGKTMKDPIRAGEDITIVSSATISSNSMAVGVKRALAIVTEGLLTPQTAAGRLPGSGT